MKYVRIITITALSIAAITTAHAQTNFSGKWNRNTDQSDSGDLSPNSVPITVTISQDKDQFAIRTVVRDGKGELHTVADNLRLDGTENINITESADKTNSTKSKVNVKWIDDKHLLYRRIVFGKDGYPDQDWKETISISGNNLVIDVDVTNNGEGYHMKEVFDKAE